MNSYNNNLLVSIAQGMSRQVGQLTGLGLELLCGQELNIILVIIIITNSYMITDVIRCTTPANSTKTATINLSLIS